jgi:hypothetical protein
VIYTLKTLTHFAKRKLDSIKRECVNLGPETKGNINGQMFRKAAAGSRESFPPVIQSSTLFLFNRDTALGLVMTHFIQKEQQFVGLMLINKYEINVVKILSGIDS